MYAYVVENLLVRWFIGGDNISFKIGDGEKFKFLKFSPAPDFNFAKKVEKQLLKNTLMI